MVRFCLEGDILCPLLKFKRMENECLEGSMTLSIQDKAAAALLAISSGRMWRWGPFWGYLSPDGVLSGSATVAKRRHQLLRFGMQSHVLFRKHPAHVNLLCTSYARERLDTRKQVRRCQVVRTCNLGLLQHI